MSTTSVGEFSESLLRILDTPALADSVPAIIDPDDYFRFAVTKEGLDSDGNVFLRAKLQISISSVRQGMARNPTVTLLLPYNDEDGSARQTRVPMSLEVPVGPSRLKCELIGRDVISAYRQLRHEFQAQLSISSAPSPFASPSGAYAPDTLLLSIGDTYTNPRYASRFEVVENGRSCTLNSDSQLTNIPLEVATPVKLSISATDSFSSAYLLLSSGTVVLIPRSYGVRYDREGCEARCQALLDVDQDRSADVSVNFAWTLSPRIDPVDLANVSGEISRMASVPSPVYFRLPVGVGAVDQGSLTVPGPSCLYRFSNGPQVGDLLLSMAVRGQGTFTTVDMFRQVLIALTDENGLTGSVVLDPGFVSENVISASVLLHPSFAVPQSGLHASELMWEFVNQELSISNFGRLSVFLTRIAVRSSDGIRTSEVNRSLAPTESIKVPLDRKSRTGDVALIGRRLDVSAELTTAGLRDFLDYNLSTQYSVQKTFIFDAVSVDFVGGSISMVEIGGYLITEHRLLPSVQLTARNRSKSVTVQTPILQAAQELTSFLSVSIHSGGAERMFEIEHDFAQDRFFDVRAAIERDRSKKGGAA